MKRVIDISGEWKLFCDKNKNQKCPEVYDEKIILPDNLSRTGKTKKSEEITYNSLTDIYKFEGFAWFQKKIYLDNLKCGETVELFLERTRKTTVFFDGELIGSENSLCTPHRYVLPSINGEHILTICVDNTDYPTCGGHMTSCDTQTNWSGITGKIELRIYGKTYCKNIKVDTNCMKNEVHLTADVYGEKSGTVEVYIDGMCHMEYTYDNGRIDAVYTPDIKLGLWDEYNHNIYTLKIRTDDDLACVDFGLRRLETESTELKINNNTIQLRGKHDGMIFPLNVSAPTDAESWIKVMKTAMEYGINHYRFHTCCPPEAAFIAADHLGIYLEPELPFWGTIKSHDEPDYNLQEHEFLIREGFRILDEFGNHPSFILFSMGNELWGNRDTIEKMLLDYKTYDNRRLYSSGSNNFQFCPEVFKNEDVFSGVRLSRERLIRGSYAMCDAPLGFVQTDIPNTVHSFDRMIHLQNNISDDAENADEYIDIQYKTQTKRVKMSEVSHEENDINIPVISHETGQYAMYPDFKERTKYTGSLQPFYLDHWKKQLIDKNMFSMSEKYFKASSALALECYKLEIEAAMKSEYLSGFQLLDLQDFTGQGVALVGILNSFMESKGIVSPKAFRGFCGDFVLMAAFEKFVYKAGEEIRAQILVSCCDPEVTGENINCFIDGKLHDVFRFTPTKKRVNKIGQFVLDTSVFSESVKLNITLESENKKISNSYVLWIYNDNDIIISDNKIEYQSEKVYICHTESEASEYIGSKKKAIVIDMPDSDSVEVSYCTDFWNYKMFSSISKSMSKPLPTGTLGLCIDDENIAMKAFLSEYYTTPPWYDIIANSHCKEIKDKDVQIIVEAIDNTENFRRLAVLYRTNGILHCTCQIQNMPDSISIKKFTESILKLL